ncbi:hypothetical protein BOTBODRAFT_237378 [Botryobasidium botryosum FD-172 SS1]|uniref:Uncharacterized protein n=1 Tax=Botryobasidium botryosum (strain FD-172 SS1) TaxID=930990 RepID=A0A067MLN3_BOTB1|nr:hypothetical protein BOTBODRAFT_237378 [Botryobasidium botryosum FD-172 SS1]
MLMAVQHRQPGLSSLALGLELTCMCTQEARGRRGQGAKSWIMSRSCIRPNPMHALPVQAELFILHIEGDMSKCDPTITLTAQGCASADVSHRRDSNNEHEAANRAEDM